MFFLLDGARPDVLEEKMQRGLLPNVARVFGEGGEIRWATTGFPSTTGPAYTPFITGVFPGGCDFPGIRWFNRERYANGGWSFSAIRSYVGLEAFLMNRDLSPDVRTLFELMKPSASVFNAINRGVSFKGNRSKFSHALVWLYGHTSQNWARVDRLSQRKLSRALRMKAKYTFAVFPGVDELSHRHEPFSKTVEESYRIFDQTVGETVRVLEEEGILDRTLLVCSSDHGLTATGTHLELWKEIEKRGWKTLYHPKILRRDIRAACMVSGNAMANLYFKGHQGWKMPMMHDEFKRTGLLDDLLSREEIDHVITRHDRGGYWIHSRSGRAWVQGDSKVLEYRVDGKDPFGYEKLPREMHAQEVLEKTFATAYPDAPVQVLQLFRSSRAGDVVVTARVGYDLRYRHETPEHFSSHGSLHREHMMVPLLFSTKLGKPRPTRTVDVFPTILELMGEPKQPHPIDGRSLL